MDYHKDRFTDFSLLIRDESERLIAVMPANIRNGVLISHQGLTIGGLLYGKKLRTGNIVDIFVEIKRFLVREGVKRLVYKAIPYIYQSIPSDEDLYALFYHGARLVRRDVNSVIYQPVGVSYTKGRKWSIKVAQKAGVYVEESEEISNFWRLLESVLWERHGATPTHSLEEISSLKEKFPRNIRLFQAFYEKNLVAGAVIYETDFVAHTQYLANSDEGRKIGALDFLLDFLIRDRYKDKMFFSFGTSTEQEGRNLNRGLIAQKEGFGARAVMHDFYEWDLTQE